MPSAPSLAHKHPIAGYPAGSDLKSSKLSFSIDSLVGAAKCASHEKPTSRPGSARSPSPPQTQLPAVKSRRSPSPPTASQVQQQREQQLQQQVHRQRAQQAQAQAHEMSQHHHFHGSPFMGVRNPVPMSPVNQPHPFGAHLGFLNSAAAAAARSPFDFPSAALYPWFMRQNALGMHGKLGALLARIYALALSVPYKNPVCGHAAVSRARCANAKGVR